MDVIILAVYLIEAGIYALTAFVLLKKHSVFPDFSIGYHTKAAVKSKEKWDYANRTAGVVSGVFAGVILAAALLLMAFRAGESAAILCLLAVSVIAVGGVLLIPTRLLKKKFG